MNTEYIETKFEFQPLFKANNNSVIDTFQSITEKEKQIQFLKLYKDKLNFVNYFNSPNTIFKETFKSILDPFTKNLIEYLEFLNGTIAVHQYEIEKIIEQKSDLEQIINYFKLNHY